MNLMHSLNLNARITRTRERFTTNVCGRKRLSRHITDCLVCATQLRSDDEIFDMRFIFGLDWPVVASTRCVPLKGFELSYTFDHTPHRLYFCSAAGPWSTVITCSPAIDGDPFPMLRVSPRALRHGAGEPPLLVAKLENRCLRRIPFGREGHCWRASLSLGDKPRGAHWACGPRPWLHVGMPHTAATGVFVQLMNCSFLYSGLCRVPHVQCMGLCLRFCDRRHSFHCILLS